MLGIAAQLLGSPPGRSSARRLRLSAGSKLVSQCPGWLNSSGRTSVAEGSVRASAPSRAALRMFPHTQWRAARQLCCLLLSLALISIPLNGALAPRASILIPLGTTLVPLGTSIQSPNPTLVQFSVAAPSGRRIVLATNTIRFPIPLDRCASRDIAIESHRRSEFAGLPSVRSPPQPDGL